MPDSLDNELNRVLEFSVPADSDNFVQEVMRGISREQRIRRMVLWVCGLIGVLFGFAGAVMLSGPLSSLVNSSFDLPAAAFTQLAAIGGVAVVLYQWFVNDGFGTGR